MTALFTSPDLSIRVEITKDGDRVLFSGNHGTSWVAMNAEAARSLARGLCDAAQRVDDCETEREHAA